MTRNSEALASIRPGNEWTMKDDDISTIVWHTQGIDPPTDAEIQAEVARLDKAAIDKEASDKEAREAAIAHAKFLGFTDEMIAVMYPNLAPSAP